MKIALITLARKNSKRIKDKNFRDFCGHPLIGYTLGIMEGMGFNSYLVTDDKRIKKYCKENHDTINIINEDKKYTDDAHSNNMELFKELHKTIQADIYMLLQATSPIRFLPILMNAIDFMVTDPKVKSGISVYQLPTKYYWMEDPVNFNQDIRDFGGTEKKPLFVENGSFYIFRKEILEENHKHIIVKPYAQFIDKFIFDIDTEAEWQQAELTYERLKRMSNENTKKI